MSRLNPNTSKSRSAYRRKKCSAARGGFAPQRMDANTEACSECERNIDRDGCRPAAKRAGLSSLLPSPKIHEPNSTPHAPFAPSAARPLTFNPRTETDATPSSAMDCWQAAAHRCPPAAVRREAAADRWSPAAFRELPAAALWPPAAFRGKAAAFRGMATAEPGMPADDHFAHNLPSGASIPVQKLSKNRGAWCAPDQETRKCLDAGMTANRFGTPLPSSGTKK